MSFRPPVSPYPRWFTLLLIAALAAGFVLMGASIAIEKPL